MKALRKKVETLEWRLEQRERATLKDYQALMPYFESVQAKIINIFLNDVPIKQGLTHEEIQKCFADKYRTISVTYLPRRVRELVEKGQLWRRDDEDGTARFFLTLKESSEDVNGERSQDG